MPRSARANASRRQSPVLCPWSVIAQQPLRGQSEVVMVRHHAVCSQVHLESEPIGRLNIYSVA